MTLRILRFIPDMNGHDFRDVDYIRGLPNRLHPKVTMVQGEVQKVEYFADATMQPDGSIVYSGLVVKEDSVYTRSPEGLALSRALTITWVNEDDSDHELTKVRTKLYNAMEQVREGTRRRGNIIDDLKLKVIGLVMVTKPADYATALGDGQSFMKMHEVDIIAFIDTSNQDLYNAISADTTHTWLNNDTGGGVTIRNVIMAGINIWGL